MSEWSRLLGCMGMVLLLSAGPTAGRLGQADDATKNADDPHAALIGKPAPALTADLAVNGKAVKLADLKGKVVLLDFWAVWCGPCVREFPHVKELSDAYKDKGLEVVGVTGYFERYDFDKEAGKMKRAEKNLTKDQEKDMLKAFVSHHKLPYTNLVLAADDFDKAMEAYKAEAIPQVVLIDRDGKVRKVIVGGGRAKEIEAAVKELLEKK